MCSEADVIGTSGKIILGVRVYTYQHTSTDAGGVGTPGE